MKSRPLPSRAIRASNIIHRGVGQHSFSPQPMDANIRHMMHGPIRPMEEPGFFARLFRR